MNVLSRRQFSKLSLATLATAGLNPLRAAEAAAKPNSKVAGVQLGLNVPYSFHKDNMSADEILANCIKLNVSGVELRTQPVEVFLGAPAEWVYPKKAPAKDATSEEKKSAAAEAKASAEKLADWRKSAPIAKAKDFRKKYEDAGVLIEIVKVDGIFKMSDAEIDYAFALAKALGGRAISTEISKKEEDLQRVGSFADKHQLLVGYHGHAETTPEHWEKAFSLAKFNGANVDLGHFVAGNNTSPLPFIKEHYARVTHVHLKDRKKNNGPNTVFGEGDTPIIEVLHAIRDNKWPIQGTIEFEYKVPAASDQMTEIARALKYCRDALKS